MKKIVILFTVCMSFGTVNAQNALTIGVDVIDSLVNIHKSRVENIDNMTLYKTLLDYSGYRLGEESSITEWLAVLYFDSSGVLRKSKLIFSYPEEDGYYIRYFGLNKEVIYSIYYAASAMNNGYSALRYLDENGNLIYVDFIRRDDDRGGLTIEHIIRSGGYDLPMPLIYGENYDKVTNIDSLKNEIKWFFNIDSLYMPEKCIPVKFVKPQKGDKTFVYQNNIPFYPQISDFVEPICQLSVGHEVTILEINGKWYKVKYEDKEGYVSRDFLAPVERINNKNSNK